MKIQLPTMGRVVIYTSAKGIAYPALVDYHEGFGKVQLVVSMVDGSGSTRLIANVPHDEDSAPNTWRYPPRSDETIEVER